MLAASRPRISRRLAWLLAPFAPLLLGARGCGFGDIGPVVPSYTCSTNADCNLGSCVENVCAEPTASGYSLILRLEAGPAALVADQTSFTFDPTTTIETGEQDLFFPVTHDVEGTVRYLGTVAVETQISLRRPIPIGDLVDEVRASSPMPYSGGADGEPIDYRARIPSTATYDVRALPTASPTPSAAGIPPQLVGLPLSEVFPPIVRTLDATNSSAPVRLDLDYGDQLFTSCQPSSQSACTVSGRVIASAATGGPVAEADLSVVIENERGIAISTVAITGDDGSFALRLSDPTKPMRIRVGPSDARPGYPDLTLDVGAYDPRQGGDLAIPRFDTIRFEGRVERQDELVPDGVVRAIATTVYDVDGNPVPGAHYETTARTTDVSAADGAGLFALDLVRGEYDMLAFELGGSSALVHMPVLASPPSGSTSLRGQTFVLGPAYHTAGLVVGPDGKELPYATVQANPERLLDASGSAQAYARIAFSTADAGGQFDIATDEGVFDLVFSLSASEGLPTFVLPNIAVSAIRLRTLTVAIPPAVVLFGRIRDADGTPRPFGKVSAFFYRPATDERDESVIAIGETIAGNDGRYRLLVPSSVELR